MRPQWVPGRSSPLPWGPTSVRNPCRRGKKVHQVRADLPGGAVCSSRNPPMGYAGLCYIRIGPKLTTMIFANATVGT